MAMAAALIGQGALFLAPYKDPFVRLGGKHYPIAGAYVIALEHVTEKKAILIGKPEPTVFDIATKELGLQKDKILMIGDTIEMDIKVARYAGVDCLLVMTGITTIEKLDMEKSKEISVLPNYIADKVHW